MFIIKETTFGSSFIINLINSKTRACVAILPEYGASIHQITFNFAGCLYPLLWTDYGEQDFLERGVPIYKGAILFPYTDRVRNGRYSFLNQSHQLIINEPPHSLHGFLNNRKFTVENQKCTSNAAILELKYNYDGTEDGYPFPFEIINTYTLNHNGFNLETEIINTGDTEMPYALGWHPYFLIDEIDSLEFIIPADEEFVLDPDYINTGEAIPFKVDGVFKPTFNDFIFLKCFKWQSSKRPLLLKQANVPFVISIETPVDDTFNYFQVYINKENKGLGLEPLTGIGDCFNNLEGLERLGSNTSRKHKVLIKIT